MTWQQQAALDPAERARRQAANDAAFAASNAGAAGPAAYTSVYAVPTQEQAVASWNAGSTPFLAAVKDQSKSFTPGASNPADSAGTNAPGGGVPTARPGATPTPGFNGVPVTSPPPVYHNGVPIPGSTSAPVPAPAAIPSGAVTSKGWKDPSTGYPAVNTPGGAAGYLTPNGQVIDGSGKVIFVASNVPQ